MTKNTPFLLTQHEKDFEKYRTIRPEELDKISGGCFATCDTISSTPGCDGGYEGQDDD